jgi:hypothetical protein
MLPLPFSPFFSLSNYPFPEYTTTAELDSMVSHELARDPAHYGPVRCIMAAGRRVWTCGGSSAFATFREWTQAGFHIAAHSMRSMGEGPRLCPFFVGVS